MIKCLRSSRPFLILPYHRVCNQINTKGATSGAGTAYHSGAPEFTLVLSYSIFGFLCTFCRSFLSFFLFSFGYCMVYSSSIYGFSLLLWYLQTLLMTTIVLVGTMLLIFLFSVFCFYILFVYVLCPDVACDSGLYLLGCSFNFL